MEVILRNLFDKGQVITYRSKTEIKNKARDLEKGRDIGTQNAAWEIEIDQRILEIEDGEKAHIIYRSTPVSIPMEAQMIGVLNKKQIIYVLMDTRGIILEASGIGFQGIVNFPDGALKEGDTWQDSTDVELPGLPQPVRQMRTFTLQGFETHGTYQCAKISVASEEANLDIIAPDRVNTIKYSIKTTGEILFAHKEGFLVKSMINSSFTSNFQSTVMEGHNLFTQELIEVKAKVPA
ncbi:MAG: hypothetical protein RDV48_03375 [Candidatus Eremiobacteraeota bacterium]|nr:hypothetical protein [Candidatus Eremiobacteraeota bacterium]